MNLVDKIRKLSEGRGLTVSALERELEFGKGTVSKWEKSSPSADKLQKVADYFNVSIDYLMGRKIETANNTELKGAYFRLAKGAQDLGLSEDDVDAILNLYRKHQERNR